MVILRVVEFGYLRRRQSLQVASSTMAISLTFGGGGGRGDGFGHSHASAGCVGEKAMVAMIADATGLVDLRRGGIDF